MTSASGVPDSASVQHHSPSLARVARGDLCSGCGGCAALVPDKIDMRLAGPGQLRPRQHAALTEAEDVALSRVCPGLGQSVVAGDRTDDPLWGPWLQMCTGHATDPALRHAGASGGGLSALALFLIETGHVDGVIQTAAAPDLPVGNVTVLSVDRGGVLEAAGSRYAPASPLAGLEVRTEPGKRYAFIGKPCDVAALRALVQDRPALAARFPVMLSFFCAGTPSLTGAEAVLAALGADKGQVTGFRYRGNGWPGQATATLADGSTRSMSYHDSWGQILSKHVQHRCRICADGTGTAADLVCADAWEADARGYPVFAEAPGTSLIVARTALGVDLLAQAVAAGRIETTDFEVSSLTAIQPGQRDRRRGLLGRLLALRLLGFPVPAYRGLGLRAAARQGGAKVTLRNFLGMLRRARRKARPDHF